MALSSPPKSNFGKLEAILDYKFKDLPSLRQALLHASASQAKSAAHNSYERLEFLGDRVLGLCVADMLYKAYPHDKEGHLARRHGLLVSMETLVKVAESWSLGDYILAESKNFAHKRPSILADGVESILGAIYLESGLAPAKEIIQKYWKDLVLDLAVAPKDPKSALQEWGHSKALEIPNYTVLEQKGPDHDPIFHMKVSLGYYKGKELTATASGSSRKKAEKEAAIVLLAQVTLD